MKWEKVRESSWESDSKRTEGGCFETSSAAFRSVYRGLTSAGDGLRDPLRGGLMSSPGDRWWVMVCNYICVWMLALTESNDGGRL